jgi:hypothetical protein
MRVRILAAFTLVATSSSTLSTTGDDPVGVFVTSPLGVPLGVAVAVFVTSTLGVPVGVAVAVLVACVLAVPVGVATAVFVAWALGIAVGVAVPGPEVAAVVGVPPGSPGPQVPSAPGMVSPWSRWAARAGAATLIRRKPPFPVR